MNHISLFSGIGGFDLAAEWMGWNNVAHCEWNPFGQEVLKYYWPNAISYEDITKTDFSVHRGNIDIVTGGFPCQPYSVAGKRKGKEDERHLWPEMLRAIREIQPSWVVGENVRGLVNWDGGLVFDEVQAELETAGYKILPFLLPAAGVDTPHRRDRIWFVAYSDHKGRSSRLGEVFKTYGEIPERDQDAKPCNTVVARLASNPESIGGRKRIGANIDNEGWKTAEHISEGDEIRNRDSSTSGTGIYSDTNNKGLQRSEVNGSVRISGEKQNKQFTGLLPPDWKEFPTQSPICDGNDGFSSRLDAVTVFKGIEKPRKPITFSKWRNESIKAGGNAIVPQVAYQIFKAIARYEELQNL